MSVDAQPAVRVGVLGPLVVERDGAAVHLGGPKSRSVFVMLAHHLDELVRVDTLIEALWGATPPKTARNSIQVNVCQLRHRLGPGIDLRTEPSGYLLASAGAEFDVVEFEGLAESAAKRLPRDPASAAHQARQAARLWRGLPVAAELDIEPLHQRLAALDELHIAVRTTLIDAQLQLGDHHQACADAAALANEHPMREDLRVRHMVALYRSGRQTEALTVYREARRVLIEELGVEPGRRLRSLHRRILEQDNDLDPGHPAASPTVRRVEGWDLPAWNGLAYSDPLGVGLSGLRVGDGQGAVDASEAPQLRVHRVDNRRFARRVGVGAPSDNVESLNDRGRTDGLPLVLATPERVVAMLSGTSRDPQDVVGIVPPDLVECSVENAAINAVMAGCRPAHLPVVLAGVEAICIDEFNVHGLLATTRPMAPVLVVNGPAARAAGLDSGVNALGQATRANVTISRTLQLVVRTVGGGWPGEVDRATIAGPTKVGFCFAEDEAGSPWPPLSEACGMPAGTSAVTVFLGDSPRIVVDQLSRTPDALAGSFAACLRTVWHPALTREMHSLLVVSPAWARGFAEAGWSRGRLLAELNRLLTVPGSALVRGGRGGVLIACAGGATGMFSAIVGGWVWGPTGSHPVTLAIDPWT